MTAAPAAKEEKVDHAYYEELQAQLKEALNAKKAADKALSSIEDQIEKFEGPFSPSPTFLRPSNPLVLPSFGFVVLRSHHLFQISCFWGQR